MKVVRAVADDDKEVLIKIREQLAEIKTELKNLNNLHITAMDARDTAREALDKAKSAHHRIDEVEDEQKWQRRATYAAFLSAAMSFAVAAMVAYLRLK